MSKRKRGGAFQSAVTYQRMQQLMHSHAAGNSTNSPAPVEAQTKPHRDRVVDVMNEWGLSLDSARLVVDAPWITPWLDKVKKTGTNARVSHAAIAPTGGIRLKIRSTVGAPDFFDINVKESGELAIVNMPVTENLTKAFDLIVPAEIPRRQTVPGQKGGALDKTEPK